MKRGVFMGKAQNDIEEFIYKICYQPIWKAVNESIYIYISKGLKS